MPTLADLIPIHVHVNGSGFDEVAFGAEGFAQAFPSPHEALVGDGGFRVAVGFGHVNLQFDI
jgi:hypothetical protein